MQHCRSAVASLTAVLILFACTEESDPPPNDRVEVVHWTDHPIEDETSAIRASLKLSLEEQEEDLLAILTKSPDLTVDKLIEYAKISKSLVILVIAEIEEYDEQRKILDALIGHWIEVDVSVAKTLIKDLHMATLNDGLLLESLLTLALKFPAEALRFSQQYHRDFGYVLESTVFHTIVEHDPEKALELLPTIRSTTAHEWASWLARDTYTRAKHRTVDISSSQPEREERYFYDLLVARFCEDDPQFLIDRFEQISDPKMISSSVRCLLLDESLPRKVSKSQFDVLYEHLIGSDLVAVDQFPQASFIEEVEH